MHSSKIVNGNIKNKAWLIAKTIIRAIPWTCTKEILQLILNIIPAMQWVIQFVDIKSAFLMSHSTDRETFVKSPKEADKSSNKVWNLNTPYMDS